MFASAFDRAEAAALLLQRGARPELTTSVVDLSDSTAPEERLQQEIRDAQTAKSAAAGAGGKMARAAPGPKAVAGVTRAYSYGELLGKQGGLTALHFAARQGAAWPRGASSPGW